MNAPSSYPRLADPDRDAAPEVLPPHNIPVEQALLGAMLANNEVLHRLKVELVPEDFFEPAHGRIYAAIKRLVERGQKADPVQLAHFFERDEGLTEVGGAQYLARLVASVVSVMAAPDYAETVLDLSRRRELIAVLQEVTADALDRTNEAGGTELAEQAEGRIHALIERGGRYGEPISIAEAAMRVAERSNAIGKGEVEPGQRVGLPSLDEPLSGLRDGNLIILGGRPSQGKTALGLFAAYSRAAEMHERREAGQVTYFSLEMEDQELAARVLAMRMKASATEIAYRGDPELTSNAYRHAEAMRGMPLVIDDQAGLTWPMIRARAMRLHRRKPIRLMVVDHLGLARPSAEMRNAQRVHQVGEVTRGAKELAKQLGCPVLLLAQLNRDLERRENKRPMMADLRDSGEIEQDADTILFIHRPETYTRRDMLAAKGDKLEALEAQLTGEIGVAEIIFGKNRGGRVPAEPVLLNCDMASNRFWDWAA